MASTALAPVLDREQIRRALTRMAHEIVENHQGAERLALIGIRTRGVYLAQRLATLLGELEGRRSIPTGILDITLYRDDLTTVAVAPVVKKTEIDFDLNGLRVVLVDDVLYTGRTVRAALDALMDLGRPARIQLAVMIDRGHRELPIRADYVGHTMTTTIDQVVDVALAPPDESDGVFLRPRG